MSKTIKSPFEKWAGSVTLADPLTLAQAELIEAGMQAPDGIKAEVEKDRIVFYTTFDKTQLPALFGCVEKWELTNFPDNPTFETFPFSPRSDSHKLIEWLFQALQEIYTGESKVPNE
jgi:hypothetical protein